MKKTSTILAISSGLFFGQAQAEIESEFHVGYNSEYIFRGVNLGNDAYEYGLNLAGSCDCGLDWSAGIWSISPDGEGVTPDVDELDIYAGVSKDFGGGTVSAGFTAYTYDGGAPDDAEVYLGYGTQFGGVDFGLTLFYGTDGILDDQLLLEGSLGYSFELSAKSTANIGLTYGYLLDEGDAGYASDDGGVYFSATASVDVALSDEITLSPYVSYVDGSDGRLTASADGQVIGGATLTFAF